jgi:hypothetical protein
LTTDNFVEMAEATKIDDNSQSIEMKFQNISVMRSDGWTANFDVSNSRTLPGSLMQLLLDKTVKLIVFDCELMRQILNNYDPAFNSFDSSVDLLQIMQVVMKTESTLFGFKISSTDVDHLGEMLVASSSSTTLFNDSDSVNRRNRVAVALNFDVYTLVEENFSKYQQALDNYNYNTGKPLELHKRFIWYENLSQKQQPTSSTHYIRLADSTSTVPYTQSKHDMKTKLNDNSNLKASYSTAALNATQHTAEYQVVKRKVLLSTPHAQHRNISTSNINNTTQLQQSPQNKVTYTQTTQLNTHNTYSKQPFNRLGTKSENSTAFTNPMTSCCADIRTKDIEARFAQLIWKMLTDFDVKFRNDRHNSWTPMYESFFAYYLKEFQREYAMPIQQSQHMEKRLRMAMAKHIFSGARK